MGDGMDAHWPREFSLVAAVLVGAFRVRPERLRVSLQQSGAELWCLDRILAVCSAAR